jgi:2-oxoglutarate dehydrogenase E1 component
MTNDAKLGLLAGVLGVIVAGTLSANRPPQNATAPAAPAAPEPKPARAAAAAPAAPASPGALPAALDSTPVRTRPEPDATPTSRKANDDDLEP